MIRKLSVPVSALALAMMAVAVPAHAVISSASSEGDALTAKVSVLGTSLLNLNLLAKAEGTAAPNYADHQSLPLNVNAGIPLVASANVNATTLYGDATFDGATVFGQGGVTGLNLGVNLLNLFGSTPVLGLTNATLYSTSTITGDYGSLSAVGDSTITQGQLNVLGHLLDLSVYADAAPNTVVDVAGLLGLTGVHLTLNEQIGGTCSSFACAIETNALHLVVDPLGLNVVGADIVLGHSMAEVTAAVPEPGEWGMMLVGLGMLGSFGRRRRQA